MKRKRGFFTEIGSSIQFFVTLFEIQTDKLSTKYSFTCVKDKRKTMFLQNNK